MEGGKGGKDDGGRCAEGTKKGVGRFNVSQGGGPPCFVGSADQRVGSIELGRDTNRMNARFEIPHKIKELLTGKAGPGVSAWNTKFSCQLACTLKMRLALTLA